MWPTVPDMHFKVLAFLLLQCLVTALAHAQGEYFAVQVTEPYIELHTGPGRGYPVFHVVDRGERVEVITRKTDWFKVRTSKGKQGWVAREQLERTLTPAGEYTDITDATKKEFSFHRWEMGAMGGDFEDSDVMTVYGGFFFTPKFSAEVSASKIFADFSDADMADFSLLVHPFPEWRLSPFFTLGTGLIVNDDVAHGNGKKKK